MKSPPLKNQETVRGIAEALAVFHPTGPIAISVKIKNSKGLRTRVFANVEDAACFCLEQSLQPKVIAVWHGLNPVEGDLQNRAKTANVLSLCWLFIDLDSKRPENTSATDSEIEAARLLCARIWPWLSECGVDRESILAMCSGNGWHLYVPIELPNDETSRDLLKRTLGGLAEEFDNDDVEVDGTCHDAPRLAKVPLTWTRKGEATPERPYRTAGPLLPAKHITTPPTN